MNRHKRSDPLPRDFYRRPDVVQVARDLIGQTLCSRTEEGVFRGVIVESEAYCGRRDRACHAFGGRRTDRTEVMYGPPGRAYVYLCYGIHHLFNVVTNREGQADAVLIRAVEPVEGVRKMAQRRGFKPSDRRLTNGPGKLSQALDITVDLSGADLLGDRIWLEASERPVQAGQIESGPRVGVDYAGEDARLPWRFWLRESPWVSRTS